MCLWTYIARKVKCILKRIEIHSQTDWKNSIQWLIVLCISSRAYKWKSAQLRWGRVSEADGGKGSSAALPSDCVECCHWVWCPALSCGTIHSFRGSSKGGKCLAPLPPPPLTCHSLCPSAWWLIIHATNYASRPLICHFILLPVACLHSPPLCALVLPSATFLLCLSCKAWTS